jgi:hypothetical protein
VSDRTHEGYSAAKVTSNIECYKNINTSMNRLNSSNISNEGRQSNRGDYTCSSSSSGNVAGSSLEGVAVLAASFELGKVLTQALCPWKKIISSNASTGMSNGNYRVPQFLKQRTVTAEPGVIPPTLAAQRWWC